jgi:hypothetical protein
MQIIVRKFHTTDSRVVITHNKLNSKDKIVQDIFNNSLTKMLVIIQKYKEHEFQHNDIISKSEMKKTELKTYIQNTLSKLDLLSQPDEPQIEESLANQETTAVIVDSTKIIHIPTPTVEHFKTNIHTFFEELDVETELLPHIDYEFCFITDSYFIYYNITHHNASWIPLRIKEQTYIIHTSIGKLKKID